jgi:hypothetical protein
MDTRLALSTKQAGSDHQRKKSLTQQGFYNQGCDPGRKVSIQSEAQRSSLTYANRRSSMANGRDGQEGNQFSQFDSDPG